MENISINEMEDETRSQTSYEMREFSMSSNNSPPPPYSSTSLDNDSVGGETEDSFSVAESASSCALSAERYLGLDEDDYDYPNDDPSEIPFEIRKVVLEKDFRGFGLTVAGGSDSPYGDLPVFVTSLDPDGVAADSGEVRLGDRIVRVNNIDMEGKTHASVVLAIRQAGRRIVLELTEGPENIMNYIAFD